MPIILTFFWIFIFSSSIAQDRALEKEVFIELDEGILYGTLFTPDSTKKLPVLLLIPGSGPTDRDCNSSLGLKSDAFKLLAHDLGEKGIASLRIDKRTSGKSQSTFLDDIKNLEFNDFIHDAELWIDYLRSNERFSEVTVAGHSQGSLVGMLAAKNKKIKKFISISGAGRPIDEIMVEQFNAQDPEIGKQYRSFFDSIKVGRYDNSSPLIFSIPKYLDTFFYQWMSYNPVEIIASLNARIMIINGGHDIQVPVSDAQLLYAAKPNSNLVIIPKMNHVLKDAPKDPEANFATYNEPELPLSDRLVVTIEKFILK